MVLTQDNLRTISEFPFNGKHSCHISRLEKQIAISDYTSGTLTLFDIAASGAPTSIPTTIQFEGNGIVKGRQDSSHIHSSSVSPDNNYLLVLDLGCDKLYRYRIINGKMEPSTLEILRAPEGSGPRMSAFSKDGRFLYVSTELSDEILTYDAETMTLINRSMVNAAGKGAGAHVAISPDGSFVYASSRGENSGIAIFKVLGNGLLEKTDYVRTAMGPRHFTISEDGSGLLVACKEGNSLESYKRDGISGLLVKTKSTSIFAPVWVGLESCVNLFVD